MALEVIIRTNAGETWAALAAHAPSGWISTLNEGSLRLTRGSYSSTGVRLMQTDEGSLVLDLPLFMSPMDYVALASFVPKVCERVGAEVVEVSGELIAITDFEATLDTHIASQLANHAIEQLAPLMDDADGVIAVDGRLRTVLIGKRTLQRLAANGDASDIYGLIVDLVCNVQQLAEDNDIVVAPAQGIEHDGQRLAVTHWRPFEKMLTMPSDYLNITFEDAAEGMCVPSEHVQKVVGHYGLLVDEHSWLLLPPPATALEAMQQRAAHHHQNIGLDDGA